jgi:hypothetical protein
MHEFYNTIFVSSMVITVPVIVLNNINQFFFIRRWNVFPVRYGLNFYMWFI